MTNAMVRHRLTTGDWIRLAARVYALASAPPTWERQLSAAVLSRPEAIVSGRSAATLHRFEGFVRGRPEIMVPPTASARSSLARVTRSIWFHEVSTTRINGFVVANESETLCMLAGRIPLPNLESLLDDRLAAQALSTNDFAPIRRRLAQARRKDIALLFGLLDERSDDAWQPSISLLERYLDDLVNDPNVPPSTSQHHLLLGNLGLVVDRYIPAWHLILEADGRRWHTRRADFENDRARDNAAAAKGIAVLRFTWRMLTEDLQGCRRLLLETGTVRRTPLGLAGIELGAGPAASLAGRSVSPRSR